MQCPCTFIFGFVMGVGQFFRLLVISNPGLVSTYYVDRFLCHLPTFNLCMPTPSDPDPLPKTKKVEASILNGPEHVESSLVGGNQPRSALGLGVQGLGFRVWGLGFGVQGLRFRVQGSFYG